MGVRSFRILTLCVVGALSCICAVPANAWPVEDDPVIVKTSTDARALTGAEEDVAIINDEGALDIALPKLRNFEKLQTLRLSKCELTDRNWVDLLSLSKLKRLFLDNTNYSGQLPSLLESMTQLESLIIDGGELTDVDAIALASAPKLKSVSMRTVEFVEGAEFRKFPGTIEEVIVAGNAWVTLDVLSKLASNQALERVDASRCPNLEGMPASLSACSKLVEVNLYGCTALTRAGCAGLAALHSLKALNLSYTNVEGDWLQEIKHLVQLTILRMDYCRSITDDGLAFIGDLPQLSHCYFQGCVKLDGSFLSSFQKHNVLRSIVVRGCPKVDDAAVVTLTELSSIEKVDATECPLVTNEAVVALAKKFPKATIFPVPDIVRHPGHEKD